MQIAVAVSGGVDSLFSLINLHLTGHKVFAVHARFKNDLYDPSPDLAKICAKFGLDFYCLDLVEDFQKLVIDYFIQEHRLGATPNPCALCNANIKFGLLLDKALELGADKVASGHYAKIHFHENYQTLCLGKAQDFTKDQGYFLSLVAKEKLNKIIFPLAQIRKEEIYQKIQALNITIPVKKESQEICFIPKDNHRIFLQNYLDEDLAGDILIQEPQGLRKVGRHQGLWQYTEGQRKGINVAYSEPLYVIKRNQESRQLILAPRAYNSTFSVQADRLNFFVPTELWQTKLYARTRYRQKLAALDSWSYINGIFQAQFSQAQDLCSAGQVLCIYDQEENILAGGIQRA